MTDAINMISPSGHAKLILLSYSTLQHVALESVAFDDLYGMLGWSRDKHRVLVNVLAEGCRDLQEVVETDNGDLFARACDGLFERFETLCVPGAWYAPDAPDEAVAAWQNFCDSVAAPLNRPSRYGVLTIQVDRSDDVPRAGFRNWGQTGFIVRLARFFWRKLSLPACAHAGSK